MHAYRGVFGSPWNTGHEAAGYLCKIGDAVTSVAVGNHVTILDTASHGQLEIEPERINCFGRGTDISEELQCKYNGRNIHHELTLASSHALNPILVLVADCHK